MIKLTQSLIGVCLLCMPIISYTQLTKPVQFSFYSSTINGNKITFTIRAILNKGSKLIAIQKNSTLSSTINFDSSIQKNKLDTLQSVGNAKFFTDKALGSAPILYYTDSVLWAQSFQINNDTNFFVKGKVNYVIYVNDEYITGDENFSMPIQTRRPVNSSAHQHKSLLSTFILSLLAGLAAVLTPCVFPLVPITVSFFLNRSKSRIQGVRSTIWYSTSIVLIYTVPTLLFTLLFGDKVLYTISTHPASNLFFFIVFILFAISFFGAFDIALPNKWANVSDRAAGKGGLMGIFFMALTLVIVSFSCTGPLVGSLLGQTAAQGIALAPILGMLGFALGLAIPFSLFAFSPSLLKSLPKSGGWLNSVKVVFGFIELALAFKFLSNVDLAYHWRLLDREIFLVGWIVIFGLLGLYLLGKLNFTHDSALSHISVFRLFLSMLSLGFALYMLPGLWGAPLKAISGWIPPAHTQDFNLDKWVYQTNGIVNNTNITSAKALPPHKYTDILHAPFGLQTYFDMHEATAAAKILNKPIMLDFTGHSCANCRKMENEVWSNVAVLDRLKNDFVIASLYVDDRTELSLKEQYTNKKGEKITTVGEKNLDYEISTFGFNAQPLYMFLDTNGTILSDVKYGYDASVQKFIDHLDMVKKYFIHQKRLKVAL